jgi:hypothetical protein
VQGGDDGHGRRPVDDARTFAQLVPDDIGQGVGVHNAAAAGARRRRGVLLLRRVQGRKEVVLVLAVAAICAARHGVLAGVAIAIVSIGHRTAGGDCAAR